MKAVYSVPQSGRLLTVLLIDTTHTTGARREPDWRLLPKDFTAGRRQGRRPCPPKKIARRAGTAHFFPHTHTGDSREGKPSGPTRPLMGSLTGLWGRRPIGCRAKFRLRSFEPLVPSASTWVWPFYFLVLSFWGGWDELPTLSGR